MSESFDREKVIDSMFDPITSEILAELEDGKKECSVFNGRRFQLLDIERWILSSGKNTEHR